MLQDGPEPGSGLNKKDGGSSRETSLRSRFVGPRPRRLNGPEVVSPEWLICGWGESHGSPVSVSHASKWRIQTKNSRGWLYPYG